MREGLLLCVFLLAAFVVAWLWGRALRYLDERSQAFRRWTFFLMGYTRMAQGEARALLLSVSYYVLGLMAGLGLMLVFGLRASALVSFSAAQLALALLGAIGEISLTDLLVDLACRATRMREPERFAELGEIPWMKGLRQLPERVVPLAAATGGVVEELFFRGVVLRVLTERFAVAPLAAVAIAGALFCFEQLVQVQTRFQALVIGCGCVAISAVGGLLVVVTGSVVPAVLCHASFVLFFMTRGGAASAGLAQVGRMRAAAR